MSFTDGNRQSVSGIEPRLSQRIDPSSRNVTNIIPFPDARASRQRPESAKARVLSLPLRQAVGKVKEAVLRLARGANTVGVQRKRGSSSALAEHDPQHHHAPVLDHRGRAIRERRSG